MALLVAQRTPAAMRELWVAPEVAWQGNKPFQSAASVGLRAAAGNSARIVPGCLAPTLAPVFSFCLELVCLHPRHSAVPACLVTLLQAGAGLLEVTVPAMGLVTLASGWAEGRRALLMGQGCSQGHRRGQETQWWLAWACTRVGWRSVTKPAMAAPPHGSQLIWLGWKQSGTWGVVAGYLHAGRRAERFLGRRSVWGDALRNALPGKQMKMRSLLKINALEFSLCLYNAHYPSTNTFIHFSTCISFLVFLCVSLPCSVPCLSEESGQKLESVSSLT